MTNKEIYKKTLVFSVRKILINIISTLLLVLLCGAGFLIADLTTEKGLIGLGIGFLIAVIALILISRFVTYSISAGQIAMMTKGITEGKLPDDVYKEGKAIVKKRFVTVAAYFAVTRVIKGIFNQLGKGITTVGEKVGGDAGGAVGSAISITIQVVVAYLCDCCLGWVFYRENQSAAKATCEGAVVFFKHGKTLAKNMGRIFGMGILSLIIIGGAFFGIFYGITLLIPGTMEALAKEVAEASIRMDNKIPEFFMSAGNLSLVIAGILGVIVWSFIHSSFIRPFVLTGVLRNYIESGKNDIPSEDSFALLDGKSPKFAKLHKELA